jgi:hypothetical protein
MKMKDRRYWKFTTLLLVLTATFLVAPAIARSQEAALLRASSAPKASPTPETGSPSIAPTIRNVIIIGFVGGFVSRNDTKHPEVTFAEYLRDRYPSIHAEVYGNHHGKQALHNVERLLDTNHDGTLSSLEKEQATVIVYGHSWGATETVAFARDLDKMGIPVALTIQVDTIGKPLHKPAAISPNVATAINFYQTRGPLHGQPQIIAADPAHTRILGNIRMTYEDRPINCDNYSWHSRTFNKPHHKIENDFRVWDELASLINTDLPNTPSTVPAPPPSASPFFQYLRRGFQAHPTETALLQAPSQEKGN